MKLAIVGAGYVGLVTGACLADAGHSVTLIDRDAARIDSVNRGSAPIHEPGLAALLKTCVPERLTGTTDLASGVTEARIVMLAVGTPSIGGVIDLSQIEAACDEVGRSFVGRTDFPVVVVKSTVVPGSTLGRIGPVLERSSGLVVGKSVGLAVNPEFLTEGTAVDDFSHPDRVVIGASDPLTEQVVVSLYASCGAPLIRCAPATAEMIKYASNTLLATLISFSNEIAALSAKLEGVDAAEVMRGVHASRYLTSESTTAKLASFLFPGVGYGGSCLPKDTVALASLGRELGVPMPLLEQVDITNREQPHRAAAAAIREFGGVSGSCVGVLGLAFKPGTDDIRESPAFPIIGDLLAAGSSVIAHDPLAIPAAESWLGAKPGLEFEQELDLLIDKVDAIILVTGWELYLEVPKLIAEQARPIPLFDGRRFLERSSLPNYSGVGLK